MLPAAAPPPPPIVRHYIPYPARRKREMRAYARRHYGIDDYRLRDPKVIVEHVAVAGSTSAVFATFAPDVPDVELHELPGVCSHFVVGSDGSIVQMVPLALMCRHTVGLNYTAIGIEHVGFRDGDVLGNAPRAARLAAPDALAALPLRDRDRRTSSATTSRSPRPTTASASRRCAARPTATGSTRRWSATGRGCGPCRARRRIAAMETGTSRTKLDPDGEERFVSLRRALGVTSFGMNQLVLEPRQRGRIHRHERQEEVYLVLEGTLTLVVEGEEQTVERGELVRVAPEVRRQLVNRGPERVVMVALGGDGEHTGRDGQAFTSWDDSRAPRRRRSRCPTTCPS